MEVLNAFVVQKAAELIIIGRMLLGTFFILATVTTYLGVMQGHRGWTSLFIRLTVAFMLLQNYSFVINQTENIMNSVEKKINGDGAWLSQYVKMSADVHDAYVKSAKRKFWDTVRTITKTALHNLVTNISFIFNSLVMNVMRTIRAILLAILKVIGPLLIPFLVFSSTQRIVAGWYKSFVEVLAWPILWGLILTLAAKLGQHYGVTGENLELFVAMNFALGFVILFSPFILSLITSGAGIGAAASVAATGATFASMGVLKGTAQVAASGVSGAISGGVSGAMQQMRGASGGGTRFQGNLCESQFSRISPITEGVVGGIKGAARGGATGVLNAMNVQTGNEGRSFPSRSSYSLKQEAYAVSSAYRPHHRVVATSQDDTSDKNVPQQSKNRKRRKYE